MGRERREEVPGKEVAFREPGPWHASRQLTHGGSTRDLICQGLNLAVGTVDAAMLSISMLAILTLKMRDNLKAGANNRDDWPRLDVELEALRGAIGIAIRQADFRGTNLLYRRLNGSSRFSVAAGLLDGDSGRLSVEVIPLDLSAITVIDENSNGGIMTSRYFGEDIAYPYRLIAPPGRPFLDSSYSGGFSFRIGYEIAPGRPALEALITGMIGVLDIIHARLLEGAAALSAYRSLLERHHAFMKQIAALDSRKIAALVDADMVEESVRLHAGTASSRLGLQALHIANDQPRRIIDLFQDQFIH